MAWINVIKSEEATGKLKKLYGDVMSADGHVDHILSVHSLRPRTLTAHLAIYKASLHSRPNELSPRERELVAVCVSRLNGCDYCVNHHSAGLGRHIGDQELAQQLGKAAVGEPSSVELSKRESALCRYATKLTDHPKDMEAADVDSLRAAGLTDAGILDLNQIVAYFAYANRTVNGLGVEVGEETLGLHPDENEEGFRHK
ncbi:MAG: peroxidase-related enzyme [Chloroflexota bacterium]